MKQILSIILKTLLFLLSFIVIELNHNMAAGFILTLLLILAYVYLDRKIFNGHKLLTGFLLLIAYLAVFTGIVFLTWPPVKNVPAVDISNPAKTEIVETSYGKIRGVYNADHTVEVYAGIPYAKPPVGDLRWKEPQDPDKWEDIMEADHFAPMSMQTTSLPIIDSLTQIIGYHDYKISLRDNYIPPVSEDSLYLNIWKPANAGDKLPVLVYIHGGSLQTGQAWYADYNGEGLAKEGIIVVNLAYRLGVFGFFANEELAKESIHHTTGNYGLLDMVKALEWVKKEISFFGGDPDNITLAGESAGSAAVSALCTSPLAEGLFNRVVMESSTMASIDPPHSYRTYQEAIDSGNRLKKEYGVSGIDEFRKLSADQIVAAGGSQHHITIDGYALIELPYESYLKRIHNEEAIFHGYNAKESGPFLLFSKTDRKKYEERIRYYFKGLSDQVFEVYPTDSDEDAAKNWAEIYGALYFAYPHYCLNRLAVMNDIPVYEYFFSKDNGRLGSWHSGEEVYLYHNIPEDSSLYDERDRELSDIMSRHLLSFVKTGDPNAESLPYWPINEDSKTLMGYGNKIGIVEERSLKLYAILDQLYEWK
ncbi:MAG: carboxylesterase family protein [Erysipelotrichaceae bacterium]|nr:carboxylesterase family protein [Erysipelotrichaceae bacterium]